jgi:AmmeMemoRadiSam system protein A
MLSESDRKTLLAIAREAITAAAHQTAVPNLNLDTLPPTLREPRATFVTLNIDHELRGCIGGLYAELPLAQDVQQHAIAAANEDPRFPPVSTHEVPILHIEVSVLTPPEPVLRRSPEELLRTLRPEIDGVILVSGWRRSTFLPQVWERVPDPIRFLDMLSEKAGGPPTLWRDPSTEILRYQVEIFEEPRGNPQ